MCYHYLCLIVFITALNGMSVKIRNHLVSRYLQIWVNLYKFENVDKNNCIILLVQIKCLEKYHFDELYDQCISTYHLFYFLVLSSRIHIPHSVLIPVIDLFSCRSWQISSVEY